MSPLFVWICVLRGPAGHAAESGKFPPEFPRAAVFTAGATVAAGAHHQHQVFPNIAMQRGACFSNFFNQARSWVLRCPQQP